MKVKNILAAALVGLIAGSPFVIEIIKEIVK